MNASETIKRIAFSKAYEFLDRDPEQNFSKLLEWLEKLGKNGFVAQQLPAIRKYASDPNSNWNRLAHSLWNDVDGEVRKTMFSNFMLNGNLLENQQLTQLRRECGCNIPWAIVIEPAAFEGATGEDSAELSFDEMDDIITQGKAMGAYFYIFSGEPLAKKEDLIALSNKNADCVFLCITSGSLIDDEFAVQLLRVRNMIPMIRMGGLERGMDHCCGEGAFAGAQSAMEILRRHRLLYGIYCQCSGENCEDVTSEQFFNTMIEWGAKGALFLPYVPANAEEVSTKVLSADQREHLIRQLQRYRKTKPLLTLDPCTSAHLSDGCIAGGRALYAISARGDAEPCPFFHCSDSSIHEKSLLEICRSPLFQRFHDQQPFDENPFRPCPILDHPESFEDLTGGKGIHRADTRCTEELHAACHACMAAAEEWKEPAHILWREQKQK